MTISRTNLIQALQFRGVESSIETGALGQDDLSPDVFGAPRSNSSPSVLPSNILQRLLAQQLGLYAGPHHVDTGPIAFAKISPDGEFVVTGGGHDVAPNDPRARGVELWSTLDGTHLVALEGADTRYPVAFSPDGRRILSEGPNGRYRRAYVWDAETGKVVHDGIPSEDVYRRPFFTKEGTALLMMWMEDRDLVRVGVWRADTPQTPTRVASCEFFGGHEVCKVSPDGYLLASAARQEHEIALQNIPIDGVNFEKVNLNGHTQKIRGLEFSPDNQFLVSWSEGGVVIVWDLATKAKRAELQVSGPAVMKVVFSNDSQKLAIVAETHSTTHGTTEIWDWAAKQHVATLPTTDRIGDVQFSADDTTLLQIVQNKAELFDANSGQSLRAFEQDVSSAVFSPQGDMLLTAGRAGLFVWDPNTGEAIGCGSAR